jgi:cell division septum initiation protein DivIVA
VATGEDVQGREVDNPRLAIHERITEIRKASFEGSRKGYDRAQVRHYLEAVADWLEGLGLGDADRGELRRELAWVGERTSEILSKAEETARELRQQGESESEKLRSEAAAEAERTRAEAETEADRMRTEAERTIAAAERRAEALLEEAARRRQDLHALIGDLLVRRDEIVADGIRLSDELAELFSTAVEAEEEEEEADADAEPEPTRRFDPVALDDIAGDTYDEDGVRIPLEDDDDGPQPIAGDPGETIESDALDVQGADESDAEEQSTHAR